jgi:hypothetical protein
LATSLLLKGKGRGKKSTISPTSSKTQLNDTESVNNPNPGPSRHDDIGFVGENSRFRPPSNLSNFTEDRSIRSNSASNVRTDTTNIFIKRLDCFLNSVAVDQIEDKQNEDECIQAYWKLFQANGQINSMVTNGISYEDFRNGYFFAAYDLSTSGKSGTGFVVPSIR